MTVLKGLTQTHKAITAGPNTEAAFKTLQSFCKRGLFVYLKSCSLGLTWWSTSWKSACQCQGHEFDPWSGMIPYATGQLSLCATATKSALWRLCSATKEVTIVRGLHNTTRESPCSSEDSVQPKTFFKIFFLIFKKVVALWFKLCLRTLTAIISKDHRGKQASSSHSHSASLQVTDISWKRAGLQDLEFF